MGTKLHGRKRREMEAQEVTRFCELATLREGPYRAPHAGRRQAFNGCRNRLNTGRASKIRLAIYLRPISRSTGIFVQELGSSRQRLLCCY